MGTRKRPPSQRTAVLVSTTRADYGVRSGAGVMSFRQNDFFFVAVVSFLTDLGFSVGATVLIGAGASTFGAGVSTFGAGDSTVGAGTTGAGAGVTVVTGSGARVTRCGAGAGARCADRKSIV